MMYREQRQHISYTSLDKNIMHISLSLYVSSHFFFLLVDKLYLCWNLQVPLHHSAVLKLQFSQPASSNQSIELISNGKNSSHPGERVARYSKKQSNTFQTKCDPSDWFKSWLFPCNMRTFWVVFFSSLSNLSKSHFRPRSKNRDRGTHTISNITTNDMKNLSNFKYTIKIMQHSISITMLLMLKKRNHIDTNCLEHIRFEMICTIRISMM